MRLRLPTPRFELPPAVLRDLERGTPLPLIGWSAPPPITQRCAATFQAVGATASNSAGGDATPAWPTHVADDIAILEVSQAKASANDPGVATLSTANGFAAITGADRGSVHNPGIGGSGVHVTAFWCRATSSSMSSPVVAGIADAVINARILTIRGAITSGDPWDVVSTAANNASGTAVTITGATTTGADRLVVVVTAGSIASATISSYANADLTSVTERNDSGTQCHLSSATGDKATAGAYGNTTATLSSASAWAGLTIAIKPAPSLGSSGNLLLLGVG